MVFLTLKVYEIQWIIAGAKMGIWNEKGPASYGLNFQTWKAKQLT